VNSSAFYVEKGQKKAKLTFQPYQVSKFTQVKVSTTQRGVEWGWIFGVRPPALAGVSVSPSTFVGGSATPVTGTVFLPTGDYPAGVKVDVSAYDETEKEFLAPIVVSIPANQRQASFSIPHSAGPDRKVTLYAQTSNTLLTTFNVLSQSLKKVSMDRAFEVGGQGTPVKITVELASPAGPDGAVVKIENDQVGVTTIPASITIPRGASSRTETFFASSVPDNRRMNVTATLGSNTESTSIGIDAPVVSDFKLNLASVQGGSATVVSGTVSINAPAPKGGLTINIWSSSDAAEAEVTPFKIAEGRKIGYAKIKHRKVAAATTVTLKAYVTPTDVKQATLTVNP
jgi:hypothetical protein